MHQPSWISRSAKCAGVLCFVVFFVGCGQKQKLPPTAPVDGTVTYKGSALTDGTITFFPESGDRPGSGIIGPGGVFRLTTFNSGDGAVLGKHKVILEVYKSAPNVAGPAGSKTMESAVPVKYTIRDKTPLTFEVVKGEKNEFKIALED